MGEQTAETAHTYQHRVTRHVGSIAGVVTARKRYRCDGHMASEPHHIEPGERYVADALPPDDPEIGNTRWLHLRLCKDCCPDEFVDRVIPTEQATP